MLVLNHLPAKFTRAGNEQEFRESDHFADALKPEA